MTGPVAMQDGRADAASYADITSRLAMTSAQAVYRRARTAIEEGEPAIAHALYLRCLSLDPRHAEALHDLGVIAAARTEDARAVSFLRQAIASRPGYAEAEDDLFAVLMRSGLAAEAVAVARSVVESRPASFSAHFNLGAALEALGDIESAIPWFGSAADIEPTAAQVFVKLANGLRATHRLNEALICADRAVGIDPGHYGARVIRGMILDALGKVEDAGIDFARAFALCPPSAEALNFLGVICIGQGRYDEATTILRQAVRLAPDQAEPHGNLGFALQKQGRLREAFAAYVKTVSIAPAHVVAQCNLAGLLINIGEFEAAVSASRLAAQCDPACIEAHVYLGIALRRLGRAGEALAAYRQVLSVRPEAGDALIEICDLRQQACDWNGIAAEQASTLDLTVRRGNRVPPFQVLTLTGSAAEQQTAARAWAAGFRTKAPPRAAYRPRTDVSGHGRLRIGYLSADFRTHATAMLIAELFERHDRTRFETYGYSFGEDDASPTRARLVAALDHCEDIRAVSHRAAAQKIQADGIDILIDLKGYTRDARPEILMHRPASIQVNYLGYPGTMGADFIDYIIADAFTVLPEHEVFFDEKIVRLPHCYQPNDTRRAAPAEPPTRRACGLPDTGFTFCCLNASYKITPEMFAIWMRLLRRKPGSVLWLFDGDRTAAENLRAAAAAHGIDPDRLIFAAKVAPEAHLARLAAADLFLDTLPVNAHTTASEALWAGLPLVTLSGEAFASRVAGSLLHAVGLPGLVTTSVCDYEALAASLSDDPVRLDQIRAHLRAARTTAPLFDTPRYARNFEAALLHMAALRDEGRRPETFAIREGTAADR